MLGKGGRVGIAAARSGRRSDTSVSGPANRRATRPTTVPPKARAAADPAIQAIAARLDASTGTDSPVAPLLSQASDAAYKTPAIEDDTTAARACGGSGEARPAVSAPIATSAPATEGRSRPRHADSS